MLLPSCRSSSFFPPYYSFLNRLSLNPVVEKYSSSECAELGHPLRTPALSKHRCCPSVSAPAWWPRSRVAACCSAPQICVRGLSGNCTCLRLPNSPPHPVAHTLISLPSFSWTGVSTGDPGLSFNPQADSVLILSLLPQGNL